MDNLVIQAHNLLKNNGFDYAVCGGFAIELFVGKAVRRHGDIDISAFWEDRDKIISFMWSKGFDVYEPCGNRICHLITNLSEQIQSTRNLFCILPNTSFAKISAKDEKDMFSIEFDKYGLTELDFVEIIFNHQRNGNFLYARNHEITLPLEKAILSTNNVPYLAPELVLLYKSTDTEREGCQTDYDIATQQMNNEQKQWLKNALSKMYPKGHIWS